MSRRSVDECKILQMPRFDDMRGSLSFVQKGNSLPFEIQRIYYLYNVPDDVTRGVHGHKKLQQLIIAISGSVDVTLNDGRNERTFSLNTPDQGLYVCPMMWRTLTNFSADAVCLVLASMRYDPDDYIHDFNVLREQNQ